MPQPIITVLMPAYNASKHLAESIDSILNQTFDDFELLVINDGSTDDTEEIIESYKDKRIRYVLNEQNIKLIATLNSGIELAEGKYIARMDADDVAMPERLEKQLAYMEANDDVALCGAAFISFGNGEEKTTVYPKMHEQIQLRFLRDCCICHPSTMIRKSVLINNNLRYDSHYPHCEDFKMWHELSKFGKLANIQIPLLRYRKHEASVSFEHANVQLENTLKVIQQQYQQLGVAFKIAEVQLLRKVFYQSFDFDLKELRKIAKLFNLLIAANQKSSFLPALIFKQYLRNHWKHLCWNNPSKLNAMAVWISNPSLVV